MENNYEYIANPITGERFQTNSLEGRAILKNLIRSSLYGGSSVQMGGGVDELFDFILYNTPREGELKEKFEKDIKDKEGNIDEGKLNSLISDLIDKLNDEFITRQSGKRAERERRRAYSMILITNIERLSELIKPIISKKLEVNIRNDVINIQKFTTKEAFVTLVDDDPVQQTSEDASQSMERESSEIVEEAVKKTDKTPKPDLEGALGKAIEDLQTCIVELITNGKNTDFVKNFDINIQLPEGHKGLQESIEAAIKNAIDEAKGTKEVTKEGDDGGSDGDGGSESIGESVTAELEKGNPVGEAQNQDPSSPSPSPSSRVITKGPESQQIVTSESPMAKTSSAPTLSMSQAQAQTVETKE